VPGVVSTLDIIKPILASTYGHSAMTSALTWHLARKIDDWPQPDDLDENREHMIRLTCWTWFSGGTTAASVAARIESALRAASA